MPSPDLYVVLGVLPTADEVVIRAAYRALAQRYHPDKWRGDPREAAARMSEINRAYAVLSDTNRRSAYDLENQRGSERESHSGWRCEEGGPSSGAPDENWAIAVTVYSDLIELNKRLKTYSTQLASEFRARLLEGKDFENRHAIARAIECEYLERYFGSNSTVQDYAKRLIFAGQKKVALELNRIVTVMGSGADPNRIISLLEAKHQPFADIVGARNQDQSEMADEFCLKNSLYVVELHGYYACLKLANNQFAVKIGDSLVVYGDPASGRQAAAHAQAHGEWRSEQMLGTIKLRNLGITNV